MAIHPEVLWAQRSSESDETKNILYVTINLPDIKEDTFKYELTPTSLSFAAQAGTTESKDYEFQLEFFEEIDPESSRKSVTSRHVALVLRKKEKKAEYWPRLSKQKVKSTFIKTDFSKWVDEDEQDGEPVKEDDGDMMGGGMPGMGGMGGMPGMGGMGGMPGMGGMGGMPGGMDFEAMMKQMGGGAGGMPSFDEGEGESSGHADEGSDSDDDGPPPLEEA